VEGAAGASAACPADAATLSAAIHARRMRRRVHAALLVEAEPVPIAQQMKVVRGVITATARPAASAGAAGAADRRTRATSGRKQQATPEQALSVALLDACLAPLACGGACPPRCAAACVCRASVRV